MLKMQIIMFYLLHAMVDYQMKIPGQEIEKRLILPVLFYRPLMDTWDIIDKIKQSQTIYVLWYSYGVLQTSIISRTTISVNFIWSSRDKALLVFKHSNIRSVLPFLLNTIRRSRSFEIIFMKIKHILFLSLIWLDFHNYY